MEKTEESISIEQIDHFFRSMAHDVRSPLHTLILHAECLQNELYGEMNDEQLKIVQRLGDAAKNLTGLVDNLLILPKITCGELSVFPADVELMDSISGCVQAMEDKARSKNIKLSLNSAMDSLWIKGDRAMVNQMLIAMLGFMIKASQGDLISIFITKDDRNAEIIVCDKSFMMAEEEILEIMGPIEALFAKQSFSYEGKEIYLAIVKEIVNAHKGTFNLNNENQQTTYSIKLPLAI